MADALVQALRRDELADSLARAGRAHVEHRFDWTRIGAQLVELATQAMGGGRPEPRHASLAPGPR